MRPESPLGDGPIDIKEDPGGRPYYDPFTLSGEDARMNVGARTGFGLWIIFGLAGVAALITASG